MFVLTVTYPGSRTGQFSVRRERVAEVRRWLNNYQELKQAIETVRGLPRYITPESPEQKN